MALLDRLTKATQDVVRGAKDFTDTARQNSLIAEEQKQIANLHAQIGKLYYETHKADSETQLGKLCLAINAANERIAKYNEEIQKIKGTIRCPSCSADIPVNSLFCGVCGSKTESSIAGAEARTEPKMTKIYCKGCGAEMAPGSAFCTFCGQKRQIRYE